MGYLHIDNLYKNQKILAFRRCYALEKVHGTSAHIAYQSAVSGRAEELRFFSDGEKHERFCGLFDAGLLEAAGEIIDSKEVRRAIGKRAVEMFKARLVGALRK